MPAVYLAASSFNGKRWFSLFHDDPPSKRQRVELGIRDVVPVPSEMNGKSLAEMERWYFTDRRIG